MNDLFGCAEAEAVSHPLWMMSDAAVKTTKTGGFMNTFKTALVSISLIIVVLLASDVVFGEEVRLRLIFNEGDTMIYKYTDIQISEQMGMKIKQEQIQYFEQKVISVDEDVATIEMTIKRVVLNAENPMTGKISFDSDEKKDETDEIAQNFDFYNMMIGKPFLVKMDSLGNVVSVKGFSDIGNEIIDSFMEKAGSDMQAKMQADSMKEMFTDEAMSRIFGQANTSFPKEGIEPGAEWEEKDSVALPMIGELKSTLKNRLDAVDDNLAKIKFSGTLEMIPAEAEEGEAAEDDPMAAMRKMMKFTEGKVEGLVEFDRERGLIKKRKQQTTMTISMMGQSMTTNTEEIMELAEYKSGA